jgi:hypothetical protein
MTTTDYRKLFSFIYGLSFGYAKGRFTETVYEPEYLNLQDSYYKTLYMDLILGVNVNVFKFMHFQLAHKFEPYGPYNVIKDHGGFSGLIQHSVSASFRSFIF